MTRNGGTRQTGRDAALDCDIGEVFAALPDTAIGVAVSGGSDSVALLHLSVQLAGPTRTPIRAATVDHRLRAEAALEARRVGDLCRHLGIAHDILRWDDKAGTGNLQARARDARYSLLARWARNRGIGAILLGHTADDLAETFLMRLARRSGVDGLSPMARSFRRDEVLFHRPLWRQARSDLRSYLVREGVAWSEDPGNEDGRFERARARRAMRVLSELGIGADGLRAVSLNMEMARDALVFQAQEASRRIVAQDRGDLIFERDACLALPSETRRRLLQAALRWIGGSAYPSRARALADLEDAVRAGERMTLAGCDMTLERDAFRITREWSAVRDTVARSDAPWDRGRWRLDGSGPVHAHIRALGKDGLRECPDWRDTGLPRGSLLASPSVWLGEDLIAAPLAGRPEGWRAYLAPKRDNFAESIGSH